MTAQARDTTSPGLRPVAVEDVYRAVYDRMKRAAFVMTGSNETAEDVVQDAFVQLYSRFDRRRRSQAGYRRR